MQLAVIGNEGHKEALLLKKTNPSIQVAFVSRPQDVPASATVVIDLLFEPGPERISLLKEFLPRPVIINAVSHTIAVIKEPFIRINAWPTFLNRDIAELVALPAQQQMVKEIFGELDWRYQLVPDQPGMVSARIISMIINEAYYALGEGVSSKSAIDTAMKLGTRYPFGPFEWGEKIGLKNIYELLFQLSRENSLYEISPALINESRR